MSADGKPIKTGRTILRPAAGALGGPPVPARPAPQPDRPGRRGVTLPQPDARRREKSLEGLGNLLKTKREINGLTRKDVVVKIKIPLDQLEAIEEGRLSSLPLVFAKGFLRAYANELGLDAEAILEDYRQMTGGFKNEPASREPLAPRYVETSVGRVWRPSPRALVISGLVLLTLVVALWLLPGFRSALGSLIPFVDRAPAVTAADSTPADSLESGLSAPAAVTEPSPSAFLDSAQEPQDDDGFIGDPLSESPPAETGLAAATGSLAPPPGAGPAMAGGGGTLTLSSLADRVWVQLVVDGQEPEYILLKTGQTVTRRADQGIVVTAGQATAINVNWNGEDLGALGDTPIMETRFPRG